MLYAGLDVHKKHCFGTVLDEKGKKVKEAKFPNTQEGLKVFFNGLEDVKVVIEATSFWLPVFEYLEKRGMEVVLSHPLKTRAIAEARIKTDKIDSETLAHLLRSDLVPASYIPPKETRELREFVRHRASIVRMRTGVKNTIHSILLKEGLRCPHNDLFSEKGIRWLESQAMKDSSSFKIRTYLSLLESLDVKIETATHKIGELSLEDAKLLMTIPGVGYYSAMLILGEIGDISRFPNPKKLCSYAGLVPSIHQSGNTVMMGNITRQGSSWLRWILVQCAHVSIRKNNRFSRFYEKVARRKGKKKAVVATARKMLVIIYWVLATKRPYDDKNKRAGHPVL